MRKKPHTRLKKSAFELHFGREPNTAISKILKIDKVYSFNGAGDVSDQVPMKQRKGTKGVSNHPFIFFEKNLPRFVGAYSDQPQIAISGTKHTITISENRVLHRKHISKPFSELSQEHNNRRTVPRGQDGRFIKSSNLQNFLDSDSDSKDHTSIQQMYITATTSEAPTTPDHSQQRTGGVGRGRPKLSRNRLSSGSPGLTHTVKPKLKMLWSHSP